MAVFRFRLGRFPISASSFSDFGLQVGGQNRDRNLTKKLCRKTATGSTECERARILGSSASDFLWPLFGTKSWPLLVSDFSFRQKTGRLRSQIWEGFP